MTSLWVLEWWQSWVTTHSELVLVVCGGWMLSTATYWLFGGALLCLDILRRPELLYSGKIQSNRPLLLRGSDWNPHWLRLFSNILAGQFLVMLPSSLLIYVVSRGGGAALALLRANGGGIGALSFTVLQQSVDLSVTGFNANSSSPSPLLPSPYPLIPHLASYSLIRCTPDLPGWLEIGTHMIAFVLVEETLFFYIHWSLHLWFYQSIHKIHHEFRAPIALAANYAHPLEVFSNIVPLAVGPLFLRSHLFTFYLWLFIAIIGTQIHHCGYRFWFWPRWDHNPNFHDWHHENFNSNFGLLGFLDRLHNTDAAYLSHLSRGKQQSAGKSSPTASNDRATCNGSSAANGANGRHGQTKQE